MLLQPRIMVYYKNRRVIT